MKRQTTILLVFLPAGVVSCWMGMMLVHESGHMLAALISGGRIHKLFFGPLAFSRTDVFPNPHPLVVAWGGPIWGALGPFLIVAALFLLRARSYFARFFSAFCLLANGAYIGLGSFGRIGDAGDLLKYGSPQWTLWLFGAATLGAALHQFHLLGPKLGLTTRAQGADALLATCVAVFLLLLGWWVR